MDCFLTATGAYLPGEPVANEQIRDFIGTLEGESEVAEKVLAMNGIVRRHYAQDRQQNATSDVYALAVRAAQACLGGSPPTDPITFLSVGTTYAPLSGPGVASMVHHHLQSVGLLGMPVEISSHGGICTSAAAALVAAVRGVQLGEHASALSIGTEHSSEVLKASVIRPIDDRSSHDDVRKSQWFMSVFLRFMLSDGAGAFLLQRRPRAAGLSLRVDWTYSRSFVHAGPLCMKLDNSTRLLTQDVSILSRYFYRLAEEFVAAALDHNRERLDSYCMVLPHMSSYFFQRRMERIMQGVSTGEQPVPYWTNLATAGNTGAASIYVILDEYLRQNQLAHNDRLLLFIPESGQFNFVLVSLTAVVQ